MKPRHRTHAGWLDEVRSRPDVPKRVKRLLAEVAEGTYVVKARNLYGITHEELSRRLGIDRSNVKRATWWAIDAGWLVVCERGHNGRQQTYHRSVPWDAPRYWAKRPCEKCGGDLTVRRSVRARDVEVDGMTVDPSTGEIVEDPEVGVRNAPLLRTPTRTPYVRSTSAPGSQPRDRAKAEAVVVRAPRLVPLAARRPGWLGWDFVAPRRTAPLAVVA